MHFLCKSATIIDTQMHPGQALFIQKVQGYVTTSAGLGMQKCRGGSSTGAGLRPFPSHSMRSMSLPALPLGGRNSLDRCALNPVARGQPRPVRGRRAQPAAAPWPPTAWAGLPTVALQRGARPPNPPPCIRTAHLFEISPEARKPPGARRRAWTTASGCPPPPPAHPCPEPLRLGDRGSRGPVREGAPGGAALGVWGCKPPAKERPRRGPEAGGAVFIRPPWGGLILVSPRTRGPTLIADKHSRSLCL